MIYTRLDKTCRAKVLAVTGNDVLMIAFWTGKQSCPKPELIRPILPFGGIARNTLVVSKKYFAKRYGVEL